MRKKLTARQQEIYDFISTAIRDHGYPPTIREIMDAFDIASTNGVRTTLAALEKKGCLGASNLRIISNETLICPAIFAKSL
jgi:SOS-response transcriptional repressor LexA